MEKILITGGLGHIGSYLINYLNRFTRKITVVDDLSAERYCTLLKNYNSFDFIEGDFLDIDRSLLTPDCTVIHLAAKTNAAASVENKDSTWATNVAKTKEFIDRCAEELVDNFIFPSTTSVYGKGQDTMYEDDDNILPQSPYAESKVEIENYIQKSDLRHWIILRLATITGVSTGMRFHTAINKFCFQACMGQKLTVWKDNYDFERPYLTLEDAAQAFDMCINPGLMRIIHNVVTDNVELSMIIKMIEKALGKQVAVDMVDTPLINQHSYSVSTKKIQREGFVPMGSIYKSISDTIAALKRS
jgi:nucleoside-diphosphate-sugar epimerase